MTENFTILLKQDTRVYITQARHSGVTQEVVMMSKKYMNYVINFGNDFSALINWLTLEQI